MDYKLAKQLKDAGFEQPLIEGSGKGFYSRNVYVPTLSELIEACGAGFVNLQYGNEHKPWIVRAAIADKITGHKKIEGSTPEEAVAKLWLKLKEIK